MHRLFSPNFEFGGGLVLPEFERVKVGLREQLNRVITYRQENTRGVMGTHLLVQLLTNLNISLSYDIDFYIDRVENIAIQKSIALKMTSVYNQGKLFHDGVFYSKYSTRWAGIKEIIIATTDTFDRNDFKKHWRRYDPVRVMYHPMTDINLQVPDGYHDFEGNGIAVISVNIPMLAAQYKMWRDERREEDSRYSARSIEQFIQEIPIPNMLYSHLDIAVLNRLICFHYQLPVTGFERKHPFAMLDWTQKLDEMLKRYIAVLLPKRLDFDSLLAKLPIVSARSFHEIFTIPEDGFTRQVQWAILLSRLPLLAFLFHQNSQYDNKRNTYYVNRMRNYFRIVDAGSLLRSTIPPDDYHNAMDIVDYGIMPYLIE